MAEIIMLDRLEVPVLVIDGIDVTDRAVESIKEMERQ